jgi:hypothetical protein
MDRDPFLLQVDLYRLTFIGFPVSIVLFRLSCSGCPVLAVLPWLSCPSCLVLALGPCHVLAVMSSLDKQTYPFWPVQADLPRLTCQATVYRLTCTDIPVPSVLFRLASPASIPGCPATVALSCLSSPSCLVLVVLSQLSCPCCHVLTILSSLSCPGWPF